MPVGSERYITSIANGQNGSPSHKIKIHHHFVHLPFSNFYQYSTDSVKSQYFTVLSCVNNRVKHNFLGTMTVVVHKDYHLICLSKSYDFDITLTFSDCYFC